MRRTALLLLALVLTAPPTALADPFDDVFADFRKDGRIDPCAHRPSVLAQAKKDVPNDIEQYAPDFPEALDRALAVRARGGCAKGTATTEGRTPPIVDIETTPTGPADGTGAVGAATTATPQGTLPTTAARGTAPAPAPVPTATPAAAATPVPDGRAAADRDGGAPAALLLLAALTALTLLALAVWGAARFWAYEPPWLLRARHALGEAGWRAGGAWSEFTDWVRLGR